MRALILHGANDLRLEEVHPPHPGHGEVVLAVEAAMTCATDGKIMRTGAHPALPVSPAPFGHEVTGTVVAAGEGVTTAALGDAVVVANSAPCASCFFCQRSRPSLCENLAFLWGTYAEQVLVPAPIVATNLLPRPSDLPVWRAPMIEPVACAIHGVGRSEAGDGDTVVIIGGGVHGQLICAGLAERGCRVIVCDPHSDRRERALAFGADAVADAVRDETGARAVRRLTPGGRGADVVFEVVGRPETWEMSLAVARAGAEINLYGGCPVDTNVTFPTRPLHYGELRVQGSYHHTPDAVRDALALLRRDDVPFEELVGEPVGLEEVSAVLARSGPKRPVLPSP